ncbi:cytochrome P450 [Gonapodya prolifera JEL478]|uniref:Cytochrome P450 n=1 Tax=Gonapodya prolifera (strain JEL478) TaxID=1344416 RepID=A0A139A1H3_GONPJ|nr:cytochrome P450 [Gonapodya prolifera JEL478]|eukprot:KXS10591.1 cytochrome P450 [Gonapodya prolifera JEL478]
MMASILAIFTISNIISILLLLLATSFVSFLFDWFLASPLGLLSRDVWSMFIPLRMAVAGALGTECAMHNELHQKYGSVCRLSSAEICIADPELVHQVLKIWDLPKPEEIYGQMKLLKSDPDNIFITSDKAFHKRSRRLIMPAFSIRHLKNMEPLLLTIWESFERKVSTLPTEDGWASVNMLECFQNMSFDTIGITAFGLSFGTVEAGHHPLLASQGILLYFYAMKVLFPSLSDIPLQLLPIRATIKLHKDTLSKVIHDRRRLNEKGEHPVDILQILLDCVDPATGAKFSDEEIKSTVHILKEAGSDTTGATMAWVLYFLLRNPETLVKIQAELDAAFPDGMAKPMSLGQINALPFLSAVINETLRLRPVAPMVLREFPEDRTIVAHDNDGKPFSVDVPVGTTAIVSLHTLHRSPQLWLRPNKFIPDRWLETSTATLEEWSHENDQHVISEKAGHTGWGYPKLLNRQAYFPFSSGSRECIGKNFASNSVRLFCAHFLRRYEVVPRCDTGVQDEGVCFLTLTPGKKEGLQVKIKRRAV